ncbi:hypothetical protein PQO03_06335 [Lentisphaera profundi]|uniref:Lipoprotein n=1 Tax=Lentisphaera profundi TaxID=1658616 RepID=A0ABY7VR25_9BACT|nr:hypothetical protein [Lentisphaera profundi]WDE95337.1 hypothetical protein PQO03_06335 [Lentisphaera profundi]
MIKPVNFILVVSLLISLISCSEQIGGGGSSINSKVFAYGIKSDKTLGFIICSDISSIGTRNSGGTEWKGFRGSAWKGKIKPLEGPSIEYSASSESLNINGNNYDFNTGRIFIITTENSKISISQMPNEIKDGDYKKEIDRISSLKEVQKIIFKK